VRWHLCRSLVLVAVAAFGFAVRLDAADQEQRNAAPHAAVESGDVAEVTAAFAAGGDVRQRLR
jgi:hypothetical protein